MTSRVIGRAVLAACLLGGGITPLLAPAHAALPEGYPREGCWTLSDPPGDQMINNSVPSTDKDFDLLGLAVNTTATDITAYLRVDKLSMPANGAGGHMFIFNFNSGTKSVSLEAGQGDAVQTAAAAAASPWTAARVGGTVVTNVTVTATFDKTNNFVIISAPIAALSTAVAPDKIEPGKVLAQVSATSNLVYSAVRPTAGSGTFGADTVTHTDAEMKKYTVGTSPCFVPPPGILTNAGVTSVQYTDVANIGAKLTNKAGEALAGKTVTFTMGGKSTTGTTDAAGIAKVAWNPGLTAGAYSLVTTFAGDATAGEVTATTPFTVGVEKTKTTLKVVKSGTRRTVYATVKDDDGKAVAGQVVTWYINGKKVSSARTTSAGVVTLKTAKPTQTVKAVFSTVSGKYATSSAQAKV